MIKKIPRYFIFGCYLICFYLFKPFGFLIQKLKKEKLFLFIDRGFDAQDNAYLMYKYFKKKGFNSKFIIKRQTYKKDKIEFTDVVFLNTLKHFFLINIADAIISTHLGTYLNIRTSRYKFFKPNAKVIFLQHGIIKDYIPMLEYKNIKVNLFICGAKREYEYLNSCFEYPRGVLSLTGLARHDILFDSLTEKKHSYKKIFIMPTWRKWLKIDFFSTSVFYRQWLSFIEKLSRGLKTNNKNIEIVFCLHPSFNQFSSFFERICEDLNITLVNSTKCVIQDMIIDSDIFITDYSSAFFDAAYINLPLCYFQFDKEDFFNNHYEVF